MSNNEYILNLAWSLVPCNKLPISAIVNDTIIEFQETDNPDLLCRVAVKNDCVAIADITKIHTTIVSLEDDYVDWLNDEAYLF